MVRRLLLLQAGMLWVLPVQLKTDAEGCFVFCSLQALA